MTVEDLVSASPAVIQDEAAAYAALVTDAINARQAMDTGRWLLGEYVRQLKTYYRQKTIEEFADEVGVDARRLYEYAGMASFYPIKDREELSALDLTYSHYREARRLENLDQALEFLKEIALNHWTIRQTRDALKIMFSGGVNVAPGYDSPSPITDATGAPIVNHPEYEWQGRAKVRLDAKGDTQLDWQDKPALDPDKEYMVFFVAIG